MAEKPQKVKLGFIGVGHMGQLAHLNQYAQLGEICEITTLCDVKINQAKILAERFNIPKVTADYKELLADPEIDAVACIQYFENHVNLVPDVLRAGKHVITEKPLCVFPENGDKLVDIAKETGKIHMVGNHKRSDPATEYAVGVINKWKQSGEMGKMTYVRLSMPPGNWRKDCDMPFMTSEPPGPVPPEQAPRGMDEATRDKTIWFVNYYIHQVNLMRFLLGEDYRLTYADRYFFSAVSESGVNCILELEPYSTSVDWQEHALVCFERGWVRIDLPAPLAMQLAGTVTIYEDKGWDSGYTNPVMPNICAMRNQAKNFILAVKGEKSPPCQSFEAVKDLYIASDYISMAKIGEKVKYEDRNKNR
ncbi:MAG: Gfo/Idh/MocA family oxidoreductase [Oscillospiraceae bacterium]|nr:Gfo/Idh/MocA family oxidoreductase [Oscillospiraceae bacterium]